MSDQFPNQSNPYSSPSPRPGPRPVPSDHFNPWMVKAPAIALLIVSILGLSASIFNIVYALTPANVDPNAPQFVRQLQENATGPVVVVLQSSFAVFNVVIIIGAIQMMRIKTWVLALVASMMAMVNPPAFCCILGIPVGIWSIVILCQPSVRKIFERNRG